MNKRFFCIFLVFIMALCAFTACQKQSKYGILIVDEQGMEHVLATDENGVTIQDKRGNLVEVMTDSKSKKPVPAPTQTVTDESGEVVSVAHEDEYATNSITFPDIIQNEEKAETRYYTVAIPEGWVQEGSSRIILRHTQTNAMISFYDDMSGDVESILEKMEKSRAKLGDADYEFSSTETKIGEVNATCASYRFGNVVRNTYVFAVKGTVFQITCTVDTAMEQQVDFNSVFNSIVFK